MFCDECTDHQKLARGCTQKALQQVNLGGEVFEFCPVKSLTRITSRYVTAWAMFNKDMLPCEGGWGSQGNKVMEAVLYLSNLQSKADREKSKKDKSRKPYSLPGQKSVPARQAPTTPKQSFKKGRPQPKRSSVRARHK
jgi:hypothetical protein